MISRNKALAQINHFRKIREMAEKQEVLYYEVYNDFINELNTNSTLREVMLEATEIVKKRHRKLAENKKYYNRKKQIRKEAVEYYQDLVELDPHNPVLQAKLREAKIKLRLPIND